MASADAEERERTRVGFPAEVEGGNPEKLSSESTEGLTTRQSDPGLSKTQAITSIAGKCMGGSQTGG